VIGHAPVTGAAQSFTNTHNFVRRSLRLDHLAIVCAGALDLAGVPRPAGARAKSAS
jgi:hypothetical protein